MEGIKIYQDDTCELFKNSMLSFTKNSNIVSINDKIIGFFNAHPRMGDMMVDYELLEEYRGKGLGDKLLEIAENYLSEKYDFDRFLLLIKYDNEKSRKVAMRRNYNVDYNMAEDMSMSGEMNGYTPFYKNVEKENEKTL